MTAHSETSVIADLDELGGRFGNRFLLEAAPGDRLPQHGMPATDAMRLIGEELVLDGIPMRNLATFVTTWMEPEAKRLIAENLHINVSGHKFGLVYPGIGWLVFREAADLPEDLVFYENYLGKTDATFTLNFSTGSAMVLAQYYNFVRFGHDGYRYIMETMQANTRALAARIATIGDFRLIGDKDDEQLPLVAFQLEGEHPYDEFDVAAQLAAERGWMVPAYTLPPNADHIKIMRALVKLTLGHSLATTLADDIAQACETLDEKGGLHPADRRRVKTGVGY